MLESVDQFESTIKEMSHLKPPGVSGSRIKNLKEYFLSHVDEEEKLTSILIDGCKSTPVSNKLGPLYVVDAIVRALIDEMGNNVDLNTLVSPPPNGTALSAIYKIQLNIESLLIDAISNSNEDIKDRISKLIDIWLNCSTFKKEILDSIKSKYYSTFTPPGTPPRKKSNFVSSSNPNLNSSSSDATKPKDATSVLQALANLAKNPSSSVTPPPPSSASIPASTDNNNFKGNSNNSDSSVSAVTNASNSSNPNAIFQLLQNMNKSNGSAQPNPVESQGNSSRDRSERSNNNDYGRNRDRSPSRAGGANNYNNSNTNNYRNDSAPSHDGERNYPGGPHYRPKKAFIDTNIPQGCINVYSRTIFIGGVPPHMTQADMLNTLAPYAEVQSCIVNTSRKHAFVKVYSRAEAEQVIQAFSVSHPSGLRARWGVGFGPRDCCNYQTGVSTIPIQRLTDADRKWIINAEWGGSTPDLPLQDGLFVEEPDIEVGHGVSSKSISRKMPTNSSHNGPKSDIRGNHNNNNNHNHNQNHNRYGGNNPNMMPINYQRQPVQQQSPYQQPNPQMMYGQPPGNMMGGNNGFLPGQPPSGGFNGMPNFNQGPPPGSAPPVLPPNLNAGAPPAPMDQNQMFAMMQAFNQMNNNNGGNGQMDVNNMMQMMQAMMNGQKPPQ